jgi:DNA-binding CsgD family transcriptional regulator
MTTSLKLNLMTPHVERHDPGPDVVLLKPLGSTVPDNHGLRSSIAPAQGTDRRSMSMDGHNNSRRGGERHALWAHARYAGGGSAQSGSRVADSLTPREHDVLAMIGQGFSNKRIARSLEISPETVKTHVKRIFLKLVVNTRTAAVYRAGSLGLLGPLPVRPHPPSAIARSPIRGIV